jgi:hypothetical protein
VDDIRAGARTRRQGKGVLKGSSEFALHLFAVRFKDCPIPDYRERKWTVKIPGYMASSSESALGIGNGLARLGLTVEVHLDEDHPARSSIRAADVGE